MARLCQAADYRILYILRSEEPLCWEGTGSSCLNSRAHFFLCGPGGTWYKVVAVTQNGVAELPSAKGVRSVAVNCAAMLTGRPQGRLGPSSSLTGEVPGTAWALPGSLARARGRT